MPDEMAGYTSKEGGKREVYREIWEEEIERLMAKGEGTKRHTMPGNGHTDGGYDPPGIRRKKPA